MGVGSRCMMKKCDFPYWDTDMYKWALISEPDIVLLMLGANDAKYYQWNQEEYHRDYIEMANIFLNMESKPELYLMVSPPLYRDGSYQMIKTVLNGVIPNLVPQIAAELGLPPENVIDIFNALGGSALSGWNFYCDMRSCDDVHPNDSGYLHIASHVYKRLFLKPLPNGDWKPASLDVEGGEPWFVS